MNKPCRKLGGEDLKAIESLIVKHTEVRAKNLRTHWKRRTVCVVGIVIISYGTHLLMESKTLEGFVQSGEAAISCLIEYAFNKSREL